MLQAPAVRLPSARLAVTATPERIRPAPPSARLPANSPVASRPVPVPRQRPAGSARRSIFLNGQNDSRPYPLLKTCTVLVAIELVELGLAFPQAHSHGQQRHEQAQERRHRE